MKTYGVIMAGGGGTRFWPLSRKETPKQLLNLSGNDYMINEAIERLSQVATYKDIFIVTNTVQKEKLLRVINKKIKTDHILVESAARNTAPCIGYAAIEIIKKYGDGIMVISPSDAYIRDSESFADVLRIAIKTVRDTDKLVTVGITPTFPSTAYGYIKYEDSPEKAKKVLRFVEKPNVKLAKKYIKSGNFVWNSGIFIWKASTILQKYKEYLPDVYACLEQLAESFGRDDEKEIIENIYPLIPSISVDYGIMEKCDDIMVVPGEFGWNDVGSWDMFGALHEPDDDGNIALGNVMAFDTADSTIYSSGRLVSVVGVKDLVVVETPDAVLVCSKDKAQDVKKVVDTLKKKGREELL